MRDKKTVLEGRLVVTAVNEVLFNGNDLGPILRQLYHGQFGPEPSPLALRVRVEIEEDR
jgi:hypothetical protein